MIGEVEVKQHGRQDGEDRSRGLCRRFRRSAVTHHFGCEQQQLLHDLDPHDLVHLSPATQVCLLAFFFFFFPRGLPFAISLVYSLGVYAVSSEGGSGGMDTKPSPWCCGQSCEIAPSPARSQSPSLTPILLIIYRELVVVWWGIVEALRRPTNTSGNHKRTQQACDR